MGCERYAGSMRAVCFVGHSLKSVAGRVPSCGGLWRYSLVVLRCSWLRAALPFSGDNGLQILTLSSFLAAVSVGSLGDRLCLVDGGLLDIGAIHRGLPRHALAQVQGRRRGGEMRCTIRPSRRADCTSWACSAVKGVNGCCLHGRYSSSA